VLKTKIAQNRAPPCKILLPIRSRRHLGRLDVVPARLKYLAWLYRLVSDQRELPSPGTGHGSFRIDLIRRGFTVRLGNSSKRVSMQVHKLPIIGGAAL
jgi:hypothetical protein